MRLVYSEAAVADLVRLRAFIAEQDPAAATRVAGELVDRVEHLVRFPNLGRRVLQAPEPDAIRDAVFANYIVRYSILTDTVVVLRIWHYYENRPQGA